MTNDDDIIVGESNKNDVSLKKSKKNVRFSEKNKIVFIPTRLESKFYGKNVTFYKKIIVYTIPNRTTL